MSDPDKPVTRLRLVLSLLSVLIYPVAILALSGDWLWLEGWLFGLWFVAMCCVIVLHMYFKDPALLAERSRKPGAPGQPKWDRYYVYGLVVCFCVWLAIMPLDARRYGWTGHFPLGLKILGGVFLLASFYFLFASTAENTFASTLVRYQPERHQRVISTGVYSFVRHPMYLGGLLMVFGAPLLLGSLYGVIAAAVFTLYLALRILGEERLLLRELEGYSEYTKKVKYRLIPFIW